MQQYIRRLPTFAQWIAYHMYTLYLFTFSDLKTIFVPITLFAFCTVPCTTPNAFARSMIWTWLHLLQFCVSNQSISLDEDARNKPWRPLPSRRLSQHYALTLRWILLPLCLLYSSLCGVLPMGFVFMLGVLLHNELKLDSHWFTRNVLNAIGYAVFDAGATTVAHLGKPSELPPTAVTAHYIGMAIVLTTIHAQDFQDEAGDRLEKRRTIPIVMPQLGRLSMLVGLTVWSLAMSSMENLPPLIRLAIVLLGVSVGARFYAFRTPKADKVSYKLYNAWLAIARISPLYGCVRDWEISS